jgi:putative endonuclease
MDGASIYILKCADGSYYSGITRRTVEERVSEQAQGLDVDSYTYHRRPSGHAGG